MRNPMAESPVMNAGYWRICKTDMTGIVTNSDIMMPDGTIIIVDGGMVTNGGGIIITGITASHIMDIVTAVFPVHG